MRSINPYHGTDLAIPFGLKTTHSTIDNDYPVLMSSSGMEWNKRLSLLPEARRYLVEVIDTHSDKPHQWLMSLDTLGRLVALYKAGYWSCALHQKDRICRNKIPMCLFLE